MTDLSRDDDVPDFGPQPTHAYDADVVTARCPVHCVAEPCPTCGAYIAAGL